VIRKVVIKFIAIKLILNEWLTLFIFYHARRILLKIFSFSLKHDREIHVIFEPNTSVGDVNLYGAGGTISGKEKRDVS
jgi:hypothetical protein